MRVLLDLGHPAHFHLFKHATTMLRAAGHEVCIVARQKDCLADLLRQAGWAFHAVPPAKGTLASIAKQSIQTLGVVLRLAARRRFDVMAGTSIVVGLAGRLTGAAGAVFGEDDAAAVPLFARLGYGPADYVVTPDCLRFEDHGRKHVTYAGYQELAYLHPSRFRPDPAVRGELGVGPGERFFLVRLVALRAHHDIGQRGLSVQQVGRLIEKLRPHGRVFVNAEADLDPALKAHALPTPPHRMHDVLAQADLVIGDSQTMIAEAAVLGTPALRCNSFVGRLTYLDELEHRWGLTAGFGPQDFDRLVGTLDEWLGRPDLKAQWARRRDAMLAQCVDLSDWMVRFFCRIGEGT